MNGYRTIYGDCAGILDPRSSTGWPRVVSRRSGLLLVGGPADGARSALACATFSMAMSSSPTMRPVADGRRMCAGDATKGILRELRSGDDLELCLRIVAAGGVAVAIVDSHPSVESALKAVHALDVPLDRWVYHLVGVAAQGLVTEAGIQTVRTEVETYDMSAGRFELGRRYSMLSLVA